MDNKEFIAKIKVLIEQSENGLEKYVLEDLLEVESVEGYLKDLLQHGCVSGMVNGLIYYSDTKNFFVKYVDEIDELVEEVEESMGKPLEITHPTSNWLAWFGYEEMARRVADKLGIEI